MGEMFKHIRRVLGALVQRTLNKQPDQGLQEQKVRLSSGKTLIGCESIRKNTSLKVTIKVLHCYACGFSS